MFVSNRITLTSDQILSCLMFHFRPFIRTVSTTARYRLFDISRFNPAKDIKPHMTRYAVNMEEYKVTQSFSDVDVAEWCLML